MAASTRVSRSMSRSALKLTGMEPALNTRGRIRRLGCWVSKCTLTDLLLRRQNIVSSNCQRLKNTCTHWDSHCSIGVPKRIVINDVTVTLFSRLLFAPGLLDIIHSPCLIQSHNDLGGTLGGKIKKRPEGRLFNGALAERVGFEPTVPCSTPDFESGTFDHSATSPERAR